MILGDYFLRYNRARARERARKSQTNGRIRYEQNKKGGRNEQCRLLTANWKRARAGAPACGLGTGTKKLGVKEIRIHWRFLGTMKDVHLRLPTTGIEDWLNSWQ